MKRFKLAAVLALIAVSLAGPVSAVPRLQTYIVDSEFSYRYNTIDSRSWITNSQQFDLKVVGYWGVAATTEINGGGYTPFTQAGSPTYDFMDTYLAISVPWNQSGTVWINGVEINSFYVYGNAVPEGTVPAWYLREMPPALYGKFNFHSIGRIDNSQTNAWHYDHGVIGSPGWGDEILMDVVVSGFDWAHFDAIGVDSKGRTYTNSYCHDSSFFATPEPGTLSLLGLGLLGMTPLLRRKKS
ncbi:MAG TPA: choice-of-anchor N protein [Candidatus Krumholzibacterium sp.]|nr:choice-of-anchor N protein [Candidatus Krumholzibacterium sp.]